MSQKFGLTGAGPGWLIFSHFPNKGAFDCEVCLASFVSLSSALTLFCSQIIYPEFPIRYFKCSQIFCGLLTLCIFPLSFLKSHILAQFLFLEFTILVRGFFTSSPPLLVNFVTFFFPANTFTHSTSIQHQLWFKAKDHFQTFSFHCSSKHPLCKSRHFFFLLFSCLDTPWMGHIVLYPHRCSVFLHAAKPNWCFGEVIEIASSRPHFAMWAFKHRQVEGFLCSLRCLVCFHLCYLYTRLGISLIHVYAFCKLYKLHSI